MHSLAGFVCIWDHLGLAQSPSIVVYSEDMKVEYVDLVPTVGKTSGDLSVYQQLCYWISLNDLALPAIMALLMILLVTWFIFDFKKQVQLHDAYSAGFAAATEKLRPELNRAQALAVVFEQMNIEMNQMRQEAICVCRRALSESYRHSEVCPVMNPLWVTHGWDINDGVWHADHRCPSLPHVLTTGPGVIAFRPCLDCANHIITPELEDAQGRTLLQDLKDWITRQGVTAWPIDQL